MGNTITYRRGQIARLRENEKKMGAYYTDVSHCLDLAKMFRFPKEEEVSVLEPSIGDGKAVIAVTGADKNPNVKIFGVELDAEVAKETKKNPYIEECVEADFLNGIRIKRNAFSFVFGNPPYMADDIGSDGGGRLEKAFLTKVTNNYLCKGGVLVWIIPYRSFYDAPSLRYLLNHYDPLAVYKFRQEEYEKWHQIVFIGRKKTELISQELFLEMANSFKLENLKEVPKEPEVLIDVPSSKSSEVNLFAPVIFHPESAMDFLLSEDGMHELGDYINLCSQILTQEETQVLNIGKPPISPSRDSLYLMSTAGCGQGKSGTEGKDLHLQRGVAEVVEDVSYEYNNDGERIEKVTSRTKITMTIVETNGQITVM